MINYKKISDADLYGMCLDGDGEAWVYVYNCIILTCKYMRFYRPEDMASKVVEELIEKRLHTVQKKEKFRSFVKMLTQSRIIDYSRSGQNREESLFIWTEDDEVEIDYKAGYHEPTQMKNLQSMQVTAIVDQAVEKLTGICRRVIREYLNFKLGLYEDYQELSRVLKMSVPNISSRVNRCMKTLIGFKEIQSLKKLIAPD